MLLLWNSLRYAYVLSHMDSTGNNTWRELFYNLLLNEIQDSTNNWWQLVLSFFLLFVFLI